MNVFHVFSSCKKWKAFIFVYYATDIDVREIDCLTIYVSVLRKKNNVWNTRREIYHHHRSIPRSSNLFKSMFSLQTPAFQVKRCYPLRRKQITSLNTQSRFADFHRTVRLFQITREEDDLWHCASVLVWVFRTEAHRRRPQPQTGSGVHLGESNRISLAVSCNFCFRNSVFRSR